MAKNVNKIIRASGKLVINPTNLSLPFPYGGTQIGYTKSLAVRSLGQTALVQSEGLGQVSDYLQANHRWVMACMIRGWDDDALALLQPDHYSVGAVTRHALMTVPGQAIPGVSQFDQAKTVLFAPDDVINVPAVIAYRAIADIQDGEALSWQRTQELGMPMAFELLQGATGKILQIGRLADLSVT